MKRPERSPTQVYPERLKSVQTDFAEALLGVRCVERTLWIVEAPGGGYMAINHKGIVLAEGPIKHNVSFAVAQCEEIMRGIWAVVEVVKPGKRQPKRKLIITQAMKKAGYYGTTPASSKRDKR